MTPANSDNNASTPRGTVWQIPPAPPSGYPPAHTQSPNAFAARQTAPYGVHPVSGIPFSEKHKVVAGLLQILVPFGAGRMYMGHIGLGVTQLIIGLVTCGIGSLWSLIDGIVILSGQPKDGRGFPLRS